MRNVLLNIAVRNTHVRYVSGHVTYGEGYVCKRRWVGVTSNDSYVMDVSWVWWHISRI